jgi:hypothetical protein
MSNSFVDDRIHVHALWKSRAGTPQHSLESQPMKSVTEQRGSSLCNCVLSKYRCPVFEANEVSGLINQPVVVVAVGKCESRAVCGICKWGGKVGFLTFPPRVFSTALAGWGAVAIKSFPCAL